MEKRNEITMFKNEELGLSVRCVNVRGREYFIGVDVATALGYVRPSKAVSDNCKGVLTEDTIKNEGGYAEKLIPEGDVYRLIIKSKLPSAERFERWIMDEILPQIRRTGGYIPIKEEDSDLDIMVKAFSIQQKTIAEKDEIISQNKHIIEEQSKTVAFIKMVSEKGNTVSMKKFADSLGIKGLGRNTLYDLLRDMKFVLPDSTEPYRKWIESGHLVSKASASKNGKLTYSTRITPKGQEYLTKKILKELDKHFIHISDTAKDYARQFIHIIGKSEEEYFAMLVKPESFRDEWEGVSRFIRETTGDEEYEEDSDYNVADEIDEMLSEIE